MKNVAPETTGYEYFKKQNDRVLKKIPLMITIRKTLRHFKVLILLNYSCTTATSFKQTFQCYQHDIYNELYCILSKL